MLADVAVNASLEERLLEAEKQVVLEEMRLNEDNPRRFLVQQLFASAFEGHPYGRPVIGTSDLIRALSRETLVGFYRRHYAPELFALVVVGAVKPEEVLRVARCDAGRPAARGSQSLASSGGAGAAPGTVRDDAARRAGLPGHGLGRPPTRPRGHAGARSSDVHPRADEGLAPGGVAA